MKLSVSLPDDDVVFIDDYASNHGIESRSAVLHRALRLLRSTQLSQAYAEAWADWAESGDEALWDAASSDGMAGDAEG